MTAEARRFQRTIEDFQCSNCRAKVRGSGYTNHCPVCLWSRHVDVAPGDRAARCGGDMQPIGVEPQRNEYVLIHRCQACDHEMRVRAGREDDFEAILELARRTAGP